MLNVVNEKFKSNFGRNASPEPHSDDTLHCTAPFAQKLPLPAWIRFGPDVIHGCLGPPNPLPQTASRSSQPLFHNTPVTGQTDWPIDRKSPRWLQWDAANSPPNCPFPFDDHHQNLIHPYQAPAHSPPQTACWSNQLFCHNSHVRTDRCDDMVNHY